MGISERRVREKAERREAIVDAAESVFLQHGYGATTMGQVAEVAEVSKGTLYLYFESKDDLRSAIAERWLTALVERLEESIADAATGLEGVSAVIDGYQAHFASHPQHCRMTIAWLAQGEVPCVTPAFEAHKAKVGEVIRIVIGQISRGQSDGTIRKDLKPNVVALTLWGNILGLHLLLQNRRAVEGRAPVALPFEDLVPSYRTIALAGLSAQPAEAAE